MKIGVISDTHNFLDPQIPKLFADVEHILHGGDIGLPRILVELMEIAPVTAVMGNTDEARFNYWETKVIELAKLKFLLHHIVNPHSLSEGFQDHLARVGPDAVIFGHTHKPFCETIGGVLFFNPGYAGKSRFGLGRSVAILHCDEQGIRPEFLAL